MAEAIHLLGLPQKHKESHIEDLHRKWYLADEGSWVHRNPIPYGEWTRHYKAGGNAPFPIHGNWATMDDGWAIYDHDEKVFYVWFAGNRVGLSQFRIGLCKIDPTDDTVTWLNNDNPIFDPLTGYSHIRYPTVIYDKDDQKYHMAIMAYNTTTLKWNILALESSYKDTGWTYNPSSPIIGGTNQNYLTPSWERVGDAVFCYVQDRNGASPYPTDLWYAKGSSRYTTFQEYPGNPVWTPGTETWESGGVGNCTFSWIFGVFFFVYGGYYSATSWQIGLAVGTTGWSYTRYPWNPILARGGSAFDWNSLSPRCLVRVEDTFYLWYNGHDGFVWQLGYAHLK